MTELQHNYNAELGKRKVLDNGSIKYPLKVFCEETGDRIVDTHYTVSPRQEERLEEMVQRFAKKKALHYEGKTGEDHSEKNISI